MSEHTAARETEHGIDQPGHGQAWPRPEQEPDADRLAAWISEYGVVLSIPSVRSATADAAGAPSAAHAGDGPAEATSSGSRSEPDEALRLRLSAQKLWAERRNPVWFGCATWLGTWVTDDRVSWRTTDGAWLAQLERSTNGRHVSLAFYERGTYVGRQDAHGFHHAGKHSRARRPRPVARSLPLPLAG